MNITILTIQYWIKYHTFEVMLLYLFVTVINKAPVRFPFFLLSSCTLLVTLI